jgi:tRNA(fMet)-specific endonuclease VapC
VIEYTLDTNVCISLINGSSVPVRSRFKQAMAGGAVLCDNIERVQTFLSGPLHILPFDDADARAVGEVRTELERVGSQIGAYDALIAAQAVRRGITLVTANTREFDRVEGLMCEDWSQDSVG